MRFRTALRISLLLLFIVFNDVTESKVIHKAKLVKVVRRESELEKTRLADGTKFERFIEAGDLPDLPIEEEEEADDLSDPRIGHLNSDGGIAIPVDSNGNVLKGFEYLMQPITIDLDEEDIGKKPIDDKLNIPNYPENKDTVKDYKPYPNNQDISPKSEFLPGGDEETLGEEYDDVASEPREPLPNVPDLPKPDYTDSGESDEDLKAEEGNLDGERDDSMKPVGVNEVIIPSSVIEQPISRDDVNESSKSADEIQEETEIKSDGDTGDKSVDIPKNRLVGESEINDNPRFEEEESENEQDNETELTDDDVASLAEDLRKSVFDNVMNKASEFGDSGSVSSDDNIDPNSINAESEFASNPEDPKEIVAESEDLDGVVLPDQSLSDEELARIAAESLKPVEPNVPKVNPSRPPVRQGKIGSGVQPDSASQFNVFIQFFLVSLVIFVL